MDARLFIAIELADTWHEAIASAQELLRRQVPERLRFVRPESTHLTLKFLGNVQESRINAITEAVTTAAARAVSFSLTVGHAGTFGPPLRPQVVWLGTGGDTTELGRLWRAVNERCALLGFPADRGRFVPHLTLARIPEALSPEAVGALRLALPVLVPPGVPALRVERVALMRSFLERGGSRYLRLAEGKLAQI